MEKDDIRSNVKDVLLVLIKPYVQKVIAHLFKNDDFTQSQSDLAQTSEVFTSILQKDLLKLVKHNIISTNKNGRTVFYAVNQKKAMALIKAIEALEDLVENEE